MLTDPCIARALQPLVVNLKDVIEDVEFGKKASITPYIKSIYLFLQNDIKANKKNIRYTFESFLCI